MRIDTIISNVQITKTTYFYKPLKKLTKYGCCTYDLYKDSNCIEYVISDEDNLDGTRPIAIEEFTVKCEYKTNDLSIFTLEIKVNDDLVLEDLLPNLIEMGEDERFQLLLVYDNKYIRYEELLEIQKILVQHYHIRSVGVTYIQRGSE